jgi:hypothetical protein
MSGTPASEALGEFLASIPDGAGEAACEGWFKFHEAKPLADGSFAPPWVEYGPRFKALWEALRRSGSLDDAEYTKWPALQDYESGARRLADAPRNDIGKWLFAVYRQERFVTGLWANKLRTGEIKTALARLIALDGKGDG